MADKIVLTGPKKVQVNENGDYITFDSRDSAFMDKLLEIVQEFEANREQYQSKIDEISTMPADSTQEQVAKSLAASKLNAEICGRLREKIDSAFHDTVCRKVFGDIEPTLDAFAEFFFQLTPIIRAAQQERNEKLRKYIDKYKKR
jgi:hypothetical protein|nr:MAG TPA: hypothetical protein [Bacteriophage sp.]